MRTGPVVVRVPALMSDEDVRRLGARVEALFRQGFSVTCDLGGSDLGVVDALARVHLLARRCGGSLQVRGVEKVADLLRLTGLSEVGGQAEALEQPLDVQEVVDVGDPPG